MSNNKIFDHVDIMHLEHLKKYNFSMVAISFFVCPNHTHFHDDKIYEIIQWIRRNSSNDLEKVIFETLPAIEDITHDRFLENKEDIFTIIEENCKNVIFPEELQDIISLIIYELLTFSSSQNKEECKKIMFYKPINYHWSGREALSFDPNNPITILKEFKHLEFVNQLIESNIISRNLIYDVFINLNFDSWFLHQCIENKCHTLIEILKEVAKHNNQFVLFENIHTSKYNISVVPQKQFDSIKFCDLKLFNSYSTYHHFQQITDNINLNLFLDLNQQKLKEMNDYSVSAIFVMYALLICYDVISTDKLKLLKLICSYNMTYENYAYLFPDGNLNLNFCEHLMNHRLYKDLFYDFFCKLEEFHYHERNHDMKQLDIGLKFKELKVC